MEGFQLGVFPKFPSLTPHGNFLEICGPFETLTSTNRNHIIHVKIKVIMQNMSPLTSERFQSKKKRKDSLNTSTRKHTPVLRWNGRGPNCWILGSLLQLRVQVVSRLR